LKEEWLLCCEQGCWILNFLPKCVESQCAFLNIRAPK
jgi:hypothetical protein